jgi:two-component system OmpR family sensor kinase
VSLRARLLAGMALVVVVLSVVVGLTTRSTRAELIGQIDERLLLLGQAESYGGDRIGYPSGGSGRPAPPGVAGDRGDVPLERISDLYEGYFDADGQLRTLFLPNLPGDAEIGAPDVSYDDAPASGQVIVTAGSVTGDATYRVLLSRGDATGGCWVVAIPIDDVAATIDELMLVHVLGAVAILAALGLVAWWVVHLGIRPVKEMTERATRIADGDLAVRVPEGAPHTESGQLALALNRMLGRIEHALDDRAQSEHRLRRFVADASHELRTPLTTIRGYAELYRMGGLSCPDALDDAMRRTEQEATRMGRLVEDMLLLAKFDEERPLDRRAVDLVQLASDAASDARVQAGARPITFDTEVDTAVVQGDEDRLRQVIGNVVGNALVHTDPTVPVAIRVRRSGSNGERDAVVLEVADRGAGMPAEVAARVTERFFRADPARARSRGGSGLGLSIVDAAVSAHGGDVEIESAEGDGTVVRLTIPTA